MLRRRKTEERAESNVIASRASEAALSALFAGDVEKARDELTAVPKRIEFAETGWKVSLVMALTDLTAGKRKSGLNLLIKVFEKLDDTSLSKDDKGYLRLFALYRAIENTRDGRPPSALRDHAENFSFDTTLVDPGLKAIFPLRRLQAQPEDAPPPPFPSGMGSIGA